MIRFLRLLPFCALALGTSAFAQLSLTTVIQRNFTVAPNAGSYLDVMASCPAGFAALSGGVDTQGNEDMEVTRSAPKYGVAFLRDLPNGDRGAPDGWYASVINYGNAARTVALSVICAPLPGVVSKIDTGLVLASFVGAPNINCPAGYVAVGGGVDVANPAAMKLTASGPRYNVSSDPFWSRPDGPQGAPVGWDAVTANQSTQQGPVQIAVVCVSRSDVVTQVASVSDIAPGQHRGLAAGCPSGHVVLGGGVAAAGLETSIITTSHSPLYAGNARPSLRAAGDYGAATGWFGDMFSHAASGTKKFAVVAICAPVAAVAAGSAVTVFEFYNTALKHYFRTSSATEATAIDGGSAGAGWIRTGDNFTAYSAGTALPGNDVCRFYTFGANSHFYTAFAEECQALKAPTTGWVYESLAFRIQLPQGSTCPAGTIPVHRLYNNRFAFNDSNHRFTTFFDDIAVLAGQGWVYEGVAFCALNFSSG
jgi:hypothetical protein